MLLNSSSTNTDSITLFEYDTTIVLTEQEIKTLNRLSLKVGFEILKPIIRNGETYYQARQYVGIISLGRRTIQILPKIYRTSDGSSKERDASQNLLLMLDYAGYLGIREVSLAALQRSQNWFEVLIYLFTDHLKRQWLRGADRNYQSVDAVLPILKGKWQIATQLRRPEQKHKFAVTYDEFTVDNPLNRLFRYIVELLWRLTKDGGNRQRLSELRYWMSEVTLLPAMSVHSANQIVLSRLNRYYEPLLNLARLFLDGLGLQLSPNDQTSFAFVFDMNKLFERFIVAFIQRHRLDILPDSLQNCDLLPQARSSPRYLATYNGRSVFRLLPDLVFRVEDHYPLLVDFKYKQIDISDYKLGVAESDFYQMYAYLRKFNTPRVILIYPQTASIVDPLRACFNLDDSKQGIWVSTINLLKNLADPIAKKALITELKLVLGDCND